MTSIEIIFKQRKCFRFIPTTKFRIINDILKKSCETSFFPEFANTKSRDLNVNFKDCFRIGPEDSPNQSRRQKKLKKYRRGPVELTSPSSYPPQSERNQFPKRGINIEL